MLGLLTVGYFTLAINDGWGGEAPRLEDIPYAELSDSALAPHRAWLKDRRGQDTPRTGVEALRLITTERPLSGPTLAAPHRRYSQRVADGGPELRRSSSPTIRKAASYAPGHSLSRGPAMFTVSPVP